MKISLITATLNNVNGLRKTIDSVRSQLAGDYELEHIIVDGESTDGTAEFLLNQQGIKVLSSPPRGIYDAVNVGIKHATGDIIGLLHADDTFARADVLKLISNAFRAFGCDFLYGDVHFEENGRITRYYSGKSASRKWMLRGFAPPHPSLYMTAKTGKNVGLYHPYFRLSGDFEMFVRLFCTGKYKGHYLEADMVCMAPGGLSSQWRHRLFTHNNERLRAFSVNGIHRTYFDILPHYIHVIKSYLWPRKQQKLH